MRSFATNRKTFLIAIIGLVGGSVWSLSSKGEIEPIVLTLVSLVEVIAYLTLQSEVNSKKDSLGEKPSQDISNHGEVKKQINIQNNSGDIKM